MDKFRVEIHLCKGCGLCVDFCGRDCLELSTELNSIGYHPPRLIDANRCSSCGMCADMCPETAIRVYRKKKKKKSSKNEEKGEEAHA